MGEVNLAKAPAGVKLALMGNEAIARGVIESGTYVVTGYPGTPSSEVIMTLQECSEDLDIYVEWAVNERVAFEVGLGASIGGARSLVTMKGPGLNVASDPLISAAYSGVDGGLIVLVADDPGPITTQTEQDSRWYGKLAKLPMITPSTPQEAKDMVVAGQNISEELKLPVILRTTTRVNHTVAEVVTGDITPPKKFMSFTKDQPRFVRAGMAWNLERHKWLNKQLTLVEDVIEKYGLNKVEGEGSICLITEGVTYAYVKEVVSRSPDNLLKSLKILKLGLIHPLPKRFLIRNLSDCSKVLVIEELDPFIEEGVKNLAFDVGLNIPIYGKLSGYLPLEGELNTDLVSNALSKLLGSNLRQLNVVKQPATYAVPARPPPLCPGCPHRNSYLAILLGLAKAGYKRDEIPIFGDIGCYALSVNPPLSAIWTEHSMGASISMAMGLKLAGFNKPVIATIGDSTFYHAGIQPLIEAVNKRVDMLVVILDNGVVAMTGHQSTPAWNRTETGRHTKPVDLYEVVKALGVDRVSVVNPYRIDEMIEKVREFIKEPGVNVLIAKAPCALLNARLRGVEKRYQVLLDKCTGCLACIRVTGCPALYVGEDGKVRIITEDCLGCGLCARFCPYKAIVEVR
ncbi:MAG: indolepyruvate ferredoxin oxidoreductase subunit alpha [Zestosphaera tikiterensis]|uniref:Indolepyruvate oxidoreductase subunit IorA n=1 Tax=Zestosphaera tikiterensis TaxID=1973259 RepID=A0A2R7Y465_9CREN|nr:MAG: indolepyruvate ferredoxin oxidoreductase subunit alpha [Zestosphaera tikiterensis]